MTAGPFEDIPRSRWPSVLDSFLCQHRGCPMSLEVTREQHTSVEAHELCLEALSTDLRNLRPRQISFALIEAPSGRLIHSISSPLHVRLSRTPGRADETLEIESQGGLRTRLSSSTTALPERFDPISVEELVDL